MGASALCTMDDANCFHMIRLELKTSVNDVNVTVVSIVTGCDVTTCATKLQGFNKHDLLTIVLRNDDIQEFASKWDGILLSMTKIPSDDILEGLYKLRIRESEKLKTVLELYNMETHRKKTGPDDHKLKTMVKRSIEQDIRNRNSGAKNGNYERNAVVKNNQGTKQRGQGTLGDCWQWKTIGQCSKGDNCSFRHEINKRAKLTQPTPSPSSFMQQNE